VTALDDISLSVEARAAGLLGACLLSRAELP
jgi:hypothetical protein